MLTYSLYAEYGTMKTDKGCMEEQKTLYRKLDEHEIEKEEYNIGMKKAGKILIVSDMDVEKLERVVFLIKLFIKVCLRRCLTLTRRCLMRTSSTCRTMRVSLETYSSRFFLSLSIHCKLEQLLKKAELNIFSN